MDSDDSIQGAPWRWPLLLSIIFLNVHRLAVITMGFILLSTNRTMHNSHICMPSLILSYGVLLVHQVNLEVPVWLALLTPTIFILTYSLTQCWCREAADSWGGPVGFRVMAAIGLVAVAASLMICAFIPFTIQPYVYGVLGGFGSSLISAQVDAVVFDTYDTRLGLVRGLCFAGQATGQALFPHILTALINTYEYSHSYIVISGIMVQALPAILFLKVDNSIKRPVSFSRYSDLAKTYAVFSNEGIENTHYYTTEMQLHNLSKKCWKSPSDDNLHREVIDIDREVDDDDLTTITPPPSPEERRRNIFGVEILPEIPEESEDSENDDELSPNGKSKKKNRSKLNLAIKRLSTLGDNLDDCISNQYRRDSGSDKDGNDNDNREYTDVEVTYETVSPVTDIQREKVFNSFTFKCQSAYAGLRRKIWMPSYKVYRMRRRLLHFIYSVNDIFIKPLTRSLSCWRFYPALALAFVKLSVTAVTLALLPLIATKMEPKISTAESNFLMTLYAFTWICFLLSTPWLSQTPKRNFKYFVFVGLIISTGACFVLAESNNHDMFSIGIVIAGFGYGAISSCWETTIQDFVGPRKWPKIHSTLETLSGCILTAFVIGLSFIIDAKDGLQLVMFIMAITLATITFIWFLIVIVSLYKDNIRSSRLARRWLLRP